MPTTRPRVNCSIRVTYMPALTMGMAQQQYSRGFIAGEKRDEGESWEKSRLLPQYASRAVCDYIICLNTT